MKIYSRLFFLFICISISAQREADNWYFGNKAGINFKNPKTEILNDGELNTPAGSASISDRNGNLLFYTNGKTVFNKNHEIMENGDGLATTIENTQTSIIIPKPNSEEIFYIFTTKTTSSTNPILTEGIFLSEVEISSRYPLGLVLSKFQSIRESASERITAVHHADGKSIWVIIFGPISRIEDTPINTFSIFKIDENGLSTPIVSQHKETKSKAGAMKASPNGKYIAIADNDRENENIDLYDFNNNTGQISFKKEITSRIPFGCCTPYGLAFSANSEILYISANPIIAQYFINTNPFPNDPLFSGLLIIGGVQENNLGSLQLASNGKIYVSLYDENNSVNKIGVINNPEKIGADTNFENHSLDLEMGASLKGLPNFIQSYFRNRIITENKCIFDPFNFNIDAYAPVTNILWDFGDGNYSSEMSPNHTYTTPGNYLVTATITINNKSRDVYKNVTAFAIPILSPNKELVECDEDFDGISTFNLFSITNQITNPILNEVLTFYKNLNDANNNLNPIINPENYTNTTPDEEIFVKATNENGCYEITSFKIKANYVSLGNISDFYTCENSDEISGNQIGNFNGRAIASSIKNQLGISDRTSLKFYPSYIKAQTNTNELIGAFSSKTATIFVKAQEADFSCGGIQSFNVIVNPDPIINLQDTYSICFNPSLKPPVIISADASNDRYEWRNSQGNIISVSKDFTLDTVGEFSLTAYKAENGLLCSNSKTFVVENPEKAVFSNIEVNTEDETNNIVSVSIQGNSTYEFSLDNVNFTGNSSTFTFNNVEAGLRTIYVRDINNCEEPIFTEVSVIGFKNFFTPNGDGKNDYWNIYGLNNDSFKTINVRIFDRYGKLIHQITDFTSLGWDGTYNSEKLIANNYWFKADIVDKDNNLISKTGYFSLIRN
ncbi:T9SS type B sorting domain-containing protein [Polaribacter vadi]|uniref:T9SS type B sorting domain-containing protein n=1 Tax=Polaribacter vadi TaxID=1774273 RepID=UPI0030EC5360|tara:strand:- start:599 stop:3295 length:2697 start_codon:yes stop_codon:yes gene_type:complete